MTSKKGSQEDESRLAAGNVWLGGILKTDVQPVGAGDDREHEQNEKYQQDRAAAAAQARSAAKTHFGLKPAKKAVEQK